MLVGYRSMSAADPRDDRNRRHAEVQTVAQANAKRSKEEEEKAARAVRDEALRQERIRLRELGCLGTI
jgi:hypothetical protein